MTLLWEKLSNIRYTKKGEEKRQKGDENEKNLLLSGSFKPGGTDRFLI